MPAPSAFPVTVAIGLVSAVVLLARLMAPASVKILEMSPAGTLVRGMVWTPVTTGFVEEASLKALALIGLTVAGGANVEPQVGSKEFATHVFIAQVLASGVALFMSSIIYAATYNEEYFFSPVIGLAGIDASILVLVAATPAVAATRLPGTELEARLAVVPFLIAYSIVSVSALGFRFSDVLLLWPSFLGTLAAIYISERAS